MIGRLAHDLAVRVRLLAGPEENAYYAWADTRLRDLELRVARERRYRSNRSWARRIASGPEARDTGA